MQTQTKSDTMISVVDGYIGCPICRQNRRVKRIAPDERGENIVCFCRKCKQEFRVDISQGQCYLSRSQ